MAVMPSKISGYRELSEDEVAVMNAIKETGKVVGSLVEKLERLESDSVQVDKRWTAIGKTELQKGFMSLTRAVAKPEFF
jgi:hypothetical protein